MVKGDGIRRIDKYSKYQEYLLDFRRNNYVLDIIQRKNFPGV